MNHQTNEYMTAKDLLYKIIEYQSEDQNIFQESSRIRMGQIDALAEAFGLSKKHVDPEVEVSYSGTDRKTHLRGLSNLQYIMHGEFLYDRPFEKNDSIMNCAIKTVKELYPYVSENDFRVRFFDLRWLFNNLCIYRQKIFNITRPWGGMLEGFSVGLHYSKHLQKKLNASILENITEIDNTLWEILDPDKREISMEVLVEKYDYQDVDPDKFKTYTDDY